MPFSPCFSLKVSAKFSVRNVNATSLGADLRFGVFDSKGTRATANTTGGINSPTFADDPGYATRLAGTAASSTPPFTVHRRVSPSTTDPLANVTSTTAAEYQALTVGVITEPANLAVQVTHNGGAQAPVAPGSYEVGAAVTEPGYSGTATGTLVIEKATATVTVESRDDAGNASARTVTATVG